MLDSYINGCYISVLGQIAQLGDVVLTSLRYCHYRLSLGILVSFNSGAHPLA